MTQLRAILRAPAPTVACASLVPMLANAHEIRQTLAFIERAKAELRAQKIAHDNDVPVGGMVEIPASVLSLGYFIEHLDFSRSAPTI